MKSSFPFHFVLRMPLAKRLQGVMAVQALSRLNRSADKLGKRTEDLFVLDFFNEAEDIKNSFDPFYTATSLSGAHGSEEERDPLDEIIRSFNERWFQGWDETPENQRVKFVTIRRDIWKHPDYESKVANNMDPYTRELALKKILDEVMNRQRRKELELYKLYAKDEAFYQAFYESMKRMLDMPESKKNFE